MMKFTKLDGILVKHLINFIVSKFNIFHTYHAGIYIYKINFDLIIFNKSIQLKSIFNIYVFVWTCRISDSVSAVWLPNWFETNVTLSLDNFCSTRIRCSYMSCSIKTMNFTTILRWSLDVMKFISLAFLSNHKNYNTD